MPHFSRGDIPKGAQFDGCCLNGFEAGSDTASFSGKETIEDHQDESYISGTVLHFFFKQYVESLWIPLDFWIFKQMLYSPDV